MDVLSSDISCNFIFIMSLTIYTAPGVVVQSLNTTDTEFQFNLKYFFLYFSCHSLIYLCLCLFFKNASIQIASILDKRTKYFLANISKTILWAFIHLRIHSEIKRFFKSTNKSPLTVSNDVGEAIRC